MLLQSNTYSPSEPFHENNKVIEMIDIFHIIDFPGVICQDEHVLFSCHGQNREFSNTFLI